MYNKICSSTASTVPSVQPRPRGGPPALGVGDDAGAKAAEGFLAFASVQAASLSLVAPSAGARLMTLDHAQ